MREDARGGSPTLPEGSDTSPQAPLLLGRFRASAVVCENPVAIRQLLKYLSNSKLKVVAIVVTIEMEIEIDFIVIVRVSEMGLSSRHLKETCQWLKSSAMFLSGRPERPCGNSNSNSIVQIPATTTAANTNAKK